MTNGNALATHGSIQGGHVYDEYSQSWVDVSPYDAGDIGIIPVAGPSGFAGYYTTPYAWTAPEHFIVGPETTFTPYASPYNADDIGIIPCARNEAQAAIEVQKQLPPSFTYEGPLGGAGFLGLFAPKPGSPEYVAYVQRKEDVKEKYNPLGTGIAPFVKNKESTTIEIAKHTEGPSLWEKFSKGVYEGYTKEPGDVNVFEESMINARNALTGVIAPANYHLLLIGGAVLLLILIIK